MTISPIEHLLKERIGLDPEIAGQLFVKRAVANRLNALAWPSDDFDRYERLIATDANELKALIEEVVVPESWFFRDELPFQFLRKVADDGWLAQPLRAPLRIMSIPCSRGEEPYSIAMTLEMAGLPQSRFRIDGVDISRRTLDQAKVGHYPVNAFRSKDISFRDCYFQSERHGFQLAHEIRSLVHFREGNLLDDPAGNRRYDIIFCRNVLIYFDAKARVKAIANLVKQLEPGGMLFVGHAEGLGLLGKDFRAVGGPGAFAFERVTSESAEKPRGDPRPTLESLARVKSLPSPPPIISLLNSLDVPNEGTRQTALVIPLQTLEDAMALADQGQHHDAAKLCQALITRNGPSGAAYYLLGLIRQALGDRIEAERCFEKVVYLDARHEEALLALARMSEGRGDAKAAENLRRRAGRSSREAAS